ncbi:MBL fold metallo-hydrolase [Massilia cavernae]|uniref:beta-lactamase n=1 Tax=Massilia cavernae TaxID=2320864 RepID=A0A418XT93_9BURK|nr:MBL fold metallo-hydrolase [Massilia cavernae]RJG15886.1 MBL fold metallo-hydrolase [Massilia cavernae]
MNDKAFSVPASMRILERGWLSSNNVLFVGRDDTALVDSGYLTHVPQTLALVEHELGRRRLDRVLNTHLHSDHCGGNAALQARYGSRVAIPVAEAAKVRAWDEAALSFRATGQQCERFTFDDTLTPGQELVLGDMPWRVLGAPGHDPHSVILFCEREGILISADALWNNGFGVIFPELDGESGFDEARATLELIRTLDARLVIPGHGAAFTDVKAAVARALARVDFLSASPKRNAENAVKVLLKFLLLSRQQIPLAEVWTMFETVPLLVSTAQRYFEWPADKMAEWTVHSLVRAGAAKREGGMLVNREF